MINGMVLRPPLLLVTCWMVLDFSEEISIVFPATEFTINRAKTERERDQRNTERERERDIRALLNPCI